jgi:pre-mRNA-splicing factor SYF2
MSSASGSAAGSSSDSTGPSKVDRLARLRNLQLKRNEARKLNHQEVVEEDRKDKLPRNFEAKRRRVEWEDEEQKKRTACEEAGDDYERMKMLDTSASEAERLDKARRKKKNPDEGFSDYTQASFRQYQRLSKQMKPDMDVYAREKQKMGETAFYPTANTLGVMEHKDSKDAVDRMVVDLEKQIDKRSKYSRRRAYDEDEDIDYINERNMKFNKKLERFYGKHTAEIKQNLERGTAV